MRAVPAENPRIALAVIVENAGFGSAAAAPIAKIAFDYFLLGKRPGDPPTPAAAQGAGARPAAPAPQASAAAPARVAATSSARPAQPASAPGAAQ